MIVKALVENTTSRCDLGTEHGLSFYIKTDRHKILFDVGQGSLFLENAQKLNIDLSFVDILVISHGHYDHGGGLEQFLQINKNAKIYLQKEAFDEHFAKRGENDIANIGLNALLKDNDRIIFCDDYLKIDDSLELFAGVKTKELFSTANKVLLKRQQDILVEDDFVHEQNLIIHDEGKFILIAGCAHNGIVNILKRFVQLKAVQPDYVIGGFHLSNPSTQKSEADSLIDQVCDYLSNCKSKFYTCHCTGICVYEKMKQRLNDKIDYIAAGDELLL